MSTPAPPAEAGPSERGWTATPVDPAAALARGRADPTVVLVLGILHRSFWPLVLVGLIGGVALAGQVEATYDDPGQVLDGLASPVAGLALALLLRIAVAVVGLVAAYPLSHGSPIAVAPHPPGRRGLVGRTTDRVHVTRALRELRATRAVREEAAARLGPRGRTLARADDLVGRAWLPLVGLLVVVAVVRAL